MTKRKPIKSNLKALRYVSLAFFGLFLLGWAMPEPFWGVHFIAFVPTGGQVGLVTLAVVLWCLFDMDVLRFPDLPKKSVRSWISIAAVTALMGVCYWQLPFAASLYGDSEVFSEKLGERTTELNDRYWESLLTPNVLHPKSGNITVLSGVRLLSYYANITHSQAYRWIATLFGMLFVVVWLAFLSRYIARTSLRMLLAVAGLTAPFMQLFFGYEEIYAPAVFLSMCYMAVLLLTLRNRSGKLLLLLSVLLFLCLKMHSVFILLVPSLLLAIALHFDGKSKRIARLLTWRNVLLFLLVPFVLVGAAAYFFVFEDHIDPRFVGPDVDIYTRLFLPLFEPEAPYDRYTLLSWNHLLDYFNMWFLWSGAMLLIFSAIVVGFRKQTTWNAPTVVVSGFTLLLFVLVYAAYNPLMSMPYDFDLFSMPATVLCAFVVALAAEVKNTHLVQRLSGSVLVVATLGLSVFIVNANPDSLSNRAGTVGVHVFKTYWIRSAGDISAAINLSTDHAEGRALRYLLAINELKPYALPGNDIEYATLLLEAGKLYRTEIKEYNLALNYHTRAQSYAPDLAANYIGLMECYYFQNQFEAAHQQALKLIEYGYPSPRQSYRIAIDCGTKAGLTPQVIQHCQAYVAQWPGDDVEQLLQALTTQPTE